MATHTFKPNIQFPLIDFVKFNVKDINVDNLEVNSLLDFKTIVNTKTGEVGTYKNAFYKGLEFKIYEQTDKTDYRRITIEGSLHKYWNSGAHNFNDFGINEVNEVLKDLNYRFNFTPLNCYLRQLEIGVNILPPIKTKKVLKACIMHKTNILKWVFTKDEGNYIQVKNQRHFIKLYDKKTHYQNKGFLIDNDIMRVEKKWCKMIELNKKGIYTIDDLINYDLINFKTDLLNLWNDVLYCDVSTIKGTNYENKYNNINWWEQLENSNFKYHRGNLKKMIKTNPKNIKNIISNLISQKVDFLNTQTVQINPLNILLKQTVSTLKEVDKNRRVCLVTGLNISMQKIDSILLSHTGLRYYLKTDIKIYNEVKSKYLSYKWIDADTETEIKEIAHNIRNKNYNSKNKQKRIYTPKQYQLFEVAV
ncbi:hypothetical protein [Polaribacter glomeratus]|uniref:Uncharacterized protein n=1 Tax=Polaribacter glomeratus TaxID=102 RepID=A0A2S7WYI8_9FLAO|nr:hypothetical protein [Polaribacter glomeratus]PQJ82625.1 hypothetical protein BTO16_08565 [Polaribacter glomeratus]TXD64919.1 hypothetical protein ESX12_12300 [Polaribacter glomeratus]